MMLNRWYKTLSCLVIGSLFLSCTFAQEIIPDFEKDSVPILNEELRKARNDITTLQSADAIPSGVIVMWSGAISAIPSGWVICDGTNSTPDLTDRFVIHADDDSGGTNDVGDTGGASTVNSQHTHTAGAHTHPQNTTGSGYPDSGGGHSITAANLTGASIKGDETTGNTYVGIGSGVSSSGAIATGNGGSTTLSIRDKYYALAYIMKT